MRRIYFTFAGGFVAGALFVAVCCHYARLGMADQTELEMLRERVIQLETQLNSLQAACQSDSQVEAFGLRSPRWAAARAAHLAAHPTCGVCGGREMLNVHHCKPFHLYSALELDPKNLTTLCELPSRGCHLNIGHSGDWRAYNPHVVVDAARMLRRRRERLYAIGGL